MNINHVRGFFCTNLPSSTIHINSLNYLSHRSWNGYLYFNRSDTSINSSLNLPASNFEIIGCLGNNPVTNNSKIILHGEIYGNFKPILKNIQNSKSLSNLLIHLNELYKLDGAYCIVIPTVLGTLICRDPIGMKPLYFGQYNNNIVISSQKKLIMDICVTKSFLPGSAFLLEKNLFLIPSKSYFISSPFNDFNGDELISLLKSSLINRIGSKKKISISFSGGIDSSILVALASQLSNVSAINVRMKNSYDYNNARKLSKLLGLDLIEVEPTQAEIIDAMPKIQNIAEVTRPLDISIGLGFYFVAQAAKIHGFQDLFVGQLADELFGGYARYLRTFKENGQESVIQMMRNDVYNAYALNFERDEKVTSPFVDLHVPYASIGVVKYGLSCPLSLKIDHSKQIRKIILKRIGKKLHLPEDILTQSKKAIHFSSGIDKIVKNYLKHR